MPIAPGSLQTMALQGCCSSVNQSQKLPVARTWKNYGRQESLPSSEQVAGIHPLKEKWGKQLVCGQKGAERCAICARINSQQLSCAQYTQAAGSKKKQVLAMRCQCMRRFIIITAGRSVKTQMSKWVTAHTGMWMGTSFWIQQTQAGLPLKDKTYEVDNDWWLISEHKLCYIIKAMPAAVYSWGKGRNLRILASVGKDFDFGRSCWDRNRARIKLCQEQWKVGRQKDWEMKSWMFIEGVSKTVWRWNGEWP